MPIIQEVKDVQTGIVAPRRRSPSALGEGGFGGGFASGFDQAQAELQKNQDAIDYSQRTADFRTGLDALDTATQSEPDHLKRIELYQKGVGDLQTSAMKDASPAVRQMMQVEHTAIAAQKQIEFKHKTMEDWGLKQAADIEAIKPDYVDFATREPDPVARMQIMGEYEGLLKGTGAGASRVRNPMQVQTSIEDYRAKVRQGLTSGIGDQLDNLTNQALRDPGNAGRYQRQGEELLAGSAVDVLPPEKVNEAKSTFKDAVWNSAVRGKIDADPYRAQKELKAGIYDSYLNQKSVLQLQGEAQSEIDRREAKAKAQRAENEKYLGKLVTDFKEAKMSGFEWRGPVSEQKLGGMVRGSEHESDFLNAQAASGILGKFNQLPPPAQEQYLRQVTEGAKTGTEAKLYSTLEGAHRKTAEGLKSDPLTFAIRQRVIPAPPALNLDDPATLQARSRLAGVAEERYGVPVSPLSDDEAAALKTQLDQAPADAQALILRKLRVGLQDRNIKAIAGQFAKKDDTLMAFAIGTSLDSPEVASRILQGKQVLKDNPNVMPKGAELKIVQDAIQNYIGDAYQHNPEHNGAVIEAAQAIYAHKSWWARDLSGTHDTGRAKASAEEATGGLLTIGSGIFGGGYKIQPPKRGMTETDFWTAVNGAKYAGLKGFTKDDIVKHGAFESVGEGRYLVKVGPGYVQGEKGPFVLDLSQPR